MIKSFNSYLLLLFVAVCFSSSSAFARFDLSTPTTTRFCTGWGQTTYQRYGQTDAFKSLTALYGTRWVVSLLSSTCNGIINDTLWNAVSPNLPEQSDLTYEEATSSESRLEIERVFVPGEGVKNSFQVREQEARICSDMRGVYASLPRAVIPAMQETFKRLRAPVSNQRDLKIAREVQQSVMLHEFGYNYGEHPSCKRVEPVVERPGYTPPPREVSQEPKKEIEEPTTAGAEGETVAKPEVETCYTGTGENEDCTGTGGATRRSFGEESSSSLNAEAKKLLKDVKFLREVKRKRGRKKRVRHNRYRKLGSRPTTNAPCSSELPNS